MQEDDLIMEAPLTPEEVEALPIPVVYDSADLKIKCSCGHVATIEKNVPQGAMRYEVYTLQGSELPFMCEACGNKLTLFFDPAEVPTKEEEENDSTGPLQEANDATSEISGTTEQRSSGESESKEEEIKEVEHESVPEKCQVQK